MQDVTNDGTNGFAAYHVPHMMDGIDGQLGEIQHQRSSLMQTKLQNLEGVVAYLA